MPSKLESSMVRLFWALVLAFPSGALRGHVVAVLWGWFLVPVGLPAIGMWHALGISYIPQFACYSLRDLLKSDEWNEQPVWLGALYSVFLSLCFWLSGWIVHRLMGA